MEWFTVDRKGLAQLLERKGRAFVLHELIQNAWDENTTKVEISLSRIEGTRNVRLRVHDDNPDGFKDLSHAFTLFAASAKKGEAEKRGRFNLGEKLVLALCKSAEIASTTGTIRFDGDGRHTLRARTQAGSIFTGTLAMTQAEMQQCDSAVRSLLAPEGVATIYNGEVLAPRAAVRQVQASLPTEIADDEGVLRQTTRKTTVRIIEPLPGETPMLYELGIPVVATGDRWHIDVGQKVPLNFDRDNVPPSYLAKVRALAVEAMCDSLTVEDANASWVREAVQKHGDTLSDSTVKNLMDLRFGAKRVAFDPSDTEANHRAASEGYTLVYGSQMSKTEWDLAKAAGAIAPAGQVMPTPRPHSSENGRAINVVSQEKWTDDMRRVVAYVEQVARHLIGADVQVRIIHEFSMPFAATYGQRCMDFNLARLGRNWFTGPLAQINSLVIHELGHEYSMDHLSSDYYRALTDLGARLTDLALENPWLFEPMRAQP